MLIENENWLSPFAPNNPSETAISLLGPSGEVRQDTVFSVPIHEFVLHDSEISFVRGKIYGNSSQLAYDENEGKIYSLWTKTLNIDYFTLEGQKQHAFSYPLQPVAITKAERDSALNRLDEPTRRVMRKNIPNVKPVAGGSFVIDVQQRVWVELLTEELGHGWFAFTTDGDPLYRIEMPHHNAILQDIRGDIVLWNYTDEKGAPSIVKSKIEIPEI